MNKSNSTIRWWDLPAAALLVVAIMTAATRLVVTGWTEHLSLVQTVALLGTLAGLALGYSRFSPRVTGLFAFLYGLFVVPWQIGSTVGRSYLWTERLEIIIDRLTTIVTQLITQDVVTDSLLFLVLMGALFWLLSVHAGYTLIRHGMGWRTVLPSGLALFAIHTFDPLIARRAWYLAVYLFFALVLISRVTFLHHHSRWQQSRTALPPHLGLDFIRFTLAAAGVIVVFAWTAPALANSVPVVAQATQPLRQTWAEMRDRMDNAFASLRSSVSVVNDYYGDNAVLGRGSLLSDTQMFKVTAPANTPARLRLYWRARVYDIYRGQWLSSADVARPFNPQATELNLPKDRSRFAGTFEITPAAYISTLFTPPQPTWVSRPAELASLTNPDGTLDLSTIRATPPLAPGQSYQVQAALANATIAQLRQAGSEYPAWVTERYLQLPDSITPRTRQLAQLITAGMETPYEKVVAVTTYLRETITYSETVPERPSNQDAVDWFLFDHQEGFCEYYATAEVVLLRSLGIPARYAVGYAQGERLEDGSYTIRQRDAHAWPEVFFPGYGWVEFEPTASQPVIERLPGSNSNSSNPRPNNDDLAARQREQLEEEMMRRAREEAQLLADLELEEKNTPLISYLYWVVPLVLGSTILGFLGWRFGRRINFQVVPIYMEASLARAGIRAPRALRLWARRAALPPLSRAYLEINHALARLGSQPAPTDTPSERARTLGRLIPPAENFAKELVTEYQLGTFSPQPANIETARKAGSEIRKLSYIAWFRRLLARIQRATPGYRTPWEKENV